MSANIKESIRGVIVIASLWKRARLFFKFQWHKRLHNYSPLVALLFLTARCNFNCNYCFAEHHGEFVDLTISQWKRIIDELKKRGTDLIFLMGGEPLLYKGVGEIIDYIKSKGLQCHLTTNGALIPYYVDTLKKVDLLMVSLDGNKEGNDLNRGRGTYERIIRGIEAARENNIPLRINCVLTRNNVDDIEWLLDFAENNFVGFTVPAKCPELDSMGSIVLSDKEIINIHRKLLKLKQEGRNITLSERSLLHVLNYPKSFHELIFKDEMLKRNYQQECCYGRYIVFVDAEGSIYPCTTLWEYPNVFKPKNIFRDGIDEALRNARELPCHICYCAGGVEWNHMSSFRGAFHALKFSLKQLEVAS